MEPYLKHSPQERRKQHCTITDFFKYQNPFMGEHLPVCVRARVRTCKSINLRTSVGRARPE